MTPPICASFPTAFTARRPPPPSPPSSENTVCRVTGVTDHATWEAIVGVYTPALVRIDAAYPVDIIMNPGQVIRRGESNPHLYLAQAMLTVLADIYKSVAEPTHSGILDEPTVDSLSSFQILCGLPMTGTLDKHTWKHLALHYPLATNLNNLP